MSHGTHLITIIRQHGACCCKNFFSAWCLQRGSEMFARCSFQKISPSSSLLHFCSLYAHYSSIFLLRVLTTSPFLFSQRVFLLENSYLSLSPPFPFSQCVFFQKKKKLLSLPLSSQLSCKFDINLLPTIASEREGQREPQANEFHLFRPKYKFQQVSRKSTGTG